MSFFESLSEEKLDQHMPDYELLHHCDHLTCWCGCNGKFCNM